jgi:hypothetical protein
VGLTTFDEKNPLNLVQEIGNATGTSPINFGEFDPLSIRFDQVFCSNDDTIDHVVHLSIQSYGGSHIQFGNVNVPAGAGFAGVPAVELLSGCSPLLSGITLGPRDNLGISVEVTMVGSSLLYIACLGGYL